MKQFLKSSAGRPLKIGILAIVALAFAFGNPFVHNASGERTYAQDPFIGTERVFFEPGFHWAGFFARTEAYPDVMSTVFDEDHLVKIRFNDATQATAQANVRWELPKDPVSMINLHKSYRSADALQERTLSPYSMECLGFAAQLMESETHYSGGQSKLKEDFRDQLLNGQYVLETKVEYERDSVTQEKIKITDTNIRKDDRGVAVRIPSDVQTYNIRAVFAAVTNVDYEPIVDEKLQAKIDQSTKESIAKQELITAQQQALTEKAKGEQLVAKTRAEEEAAKLKAVIQAEKEAEVAAQNLRRDKLNAEAKLALKKAEAQGDKLKVQAGLSPLERATIEKETAIGVAKALAGPEGIAFPKIVAGGGGKTGSSGALQVMELKMLNDLARDMAK